MVIIDEAHNLIDTINETHSVMLTAGHLSDVSAQLAQYLERYQARLKPANRLCVQQLLFVVRALRASLLPKSHPKKASASAAGSGADSAAGAAAGSAAGGDGRPFAPAAPAAPVAPVAPAPPAAAAQVEERILGINSFLCGLNIDNINLFQLKAFCHASQIAKKLHGFADAQKSVRTQSACSQHAISMSSACRPHAISMSSACNQHAISRSR